MALRVSADKDTNNKGNGSFLQGTNEVELANIYDSLQEKEDNVHSYNAARSVVNASNAGTCTVEGKEHPNDTAHVGISKVKIELSCKAICLALTGILLFCMLLCVITGVVVYVVVTAKMADSETQTSINLNITPNTNNPEALAMDVKSLKTEVIKLNDVWKQQLSSFSNESRDFQMDTHNQLDTINKASRDFQMDTKNQLDTLNNASRDTENQLEAITNASRNMENQLDTLNDVVQVVQENQKSSDTSNTLEALESEISKFGRSGGSTYIRWGKTSCPGTGTELVYPGYAGGSWFRDSGAAVSYLCLPQDPLWGKYDDSVISWAMIYGAEYEGISFVNSGRINQHDDVPCAVCRSPRPSVLMIPARNECYGNWTLEYHGYLMADRFNHEAASDYVCLDEDPEPIEGGSADKNGKLFYQVEGRCGSLKCPPYVHGRELTCVVCSK